LSPFWNFDDTGTPHRIQDVARHPRPYYLLAITKKFDQSELDRRPALASYSPGPHSTGRRLCRLSKSTTVTISAPISPQQQQPWCRDGSDRGSTTRLR